MIKLTLVFILGVLLNWGLVYLMRKRKAFQVIYELSPEEHKKKKVTPTFGGLSIVLTILLGALLFKLFSIKILWLVSLMFCYTLIGFGDDFLSQIKKINKGFSPRDKFLLQIIVGILFLGIFNFYIKPVSVLEFLFYLFIIVGAANATNLTDGLDGLLTGLGIISFSGFLALFYLNNLVELSRFSEIIIISLICFLIFNKYPAKIFMGNTGSLSLGALLAGLSLIWGNPWVLLMLGTVYIIETLSVILQVTSYKLYKKRIFKMAPLHHHFELLGFSEKNTVRIFWLTGFIFLIMFLGGRYFL